MKKNIGWFDDRSNSPGVLTSVLASDVQKLNGASSEGMGVMTESSFALVCGIIIGFVFEWRLTLVALGCVPFMMFGGAVESKLQTGMSDPDQAAYKESQLLASDAILNYRTVAGLNADMVIAAKYDDFIDEPSKNGIKTSHLVGFFFGLS